MTMRWSAQNCVLCIRISPWNGSARTAVVHSLTHSHMFTHTHTQPQKKGWFDKIFVPLLLTSTPPPPICTIYIFSIQNTATSNEKRILLHMPIDTFKIVAKITIFPCICKIENITNYAFNSILLLVRQLCQDYPSQRLVHRKHLSIHHHCHLVVQILPIVPHDSLGRS